MELGVLDFSALSEGRDEADTVLDALADGEAHIESGAEGERVACELRDEDGEGVLLREGQGERVGVGVVEPLREAEGEEESLNDAGAEREELRVGAGDVDCDAEPVNDDTAEAVSAADAEGCDAELDGDGSADTVALSDDCAESERAERLGSADLDAVAGGLCDGERDGEVDAEGDDELLGERDSGANRDALGDAVGECDTLPAVEAEYNAVTVLHIEGVADADAISEPEPLPDGAPVRENVDTSDCVVEAVHAGDDERESCSESVASSEAELAADGGTEAVAHAVDDPESDERCKGVRSAELDTVGRGLCDGEREGVGDADRDEEPLDERDAAPDLETLGDAELDRDTLLRVVVLGDTDEVRDALGDDVSDVVKTAVTLTKVEALEEMAWDALCVEEDDPQRETVCDWEGDAVGD